MAKLTVNGASVGTSIANMTPGTIFNFPISATGNSGICVRAKDGVRDGVSYKNRFVNLESGKVLYANAGDRGAILPKGTTITIG